MSEQKIKMKQYIILPLYAKVSLLIVAFAATLGILFVAKEIIVPFIFSLLIAIALTPVVEFLVRKKIKRVVAIFSTILLAISVMGTVVTIVYMQLTQFGDSLPKLVEKLDQIGDQIVYWASRYFHLSTRKINIMVEENSKEIVTANSSLIGSTLLNTGNIIINLVVIPVYVFMILLYQNHLLEFIHRIFKSSPVYKISKVFLNTKKIIQGYLAGLLIEAAIVGLLQSSSLLILDIDYAILFGLIGALLNMIPYIGSVIAVTLPMIISLTTKPPIYALLVLASYLLIQLIDNNYILPRIVASKVKLNALISLFAVFVGNAIWGIPGMFLAIPLTAIFKVVFDHSETLKPLGFLLGNNSSDTQELSAVQQTTNQENKNAK